MGESEEFDAKLRKVKESEEIKYLSCFSSGFS